VLTDAHPALLDRACSAVLVIDVQEAFHGYVPRFEQLADTIRLLLAGAQLLEVPIAASEQYPQGLGPAVGAIELPRDAPRLAKVEFAACAAPGWEELPPAVRDARQFVVTGIETHVCVRHTALALLATGREVHVCVDAVASHTDLHRDTALRSLEQAGARLTTVEQVLFDWLGGAGTPVFRQVQELLKAHTAAG